MNQVFLPEVPWIKQNEEYVVVCDGNTKLIEEQNYNSLRFLNGLHLKPKNSQAKMHNGEQTKEEQVLLDYLMDTSRLGFVNESKYFNTVQSEKGRSRDKISFVNVKPVENSSYVDVQRQEVEISSINHRTICKPHLLLEKQNSKTTDIITLIESIPNDYTRVKEVNSDNTVLLHDPCCANTDCSSNNLENPVMDKVRAELLSTGYVKHP